MQKGKAIVVSDITKEFGSIVAVDHVGFEVDEGEFFGFLGPNGAGKTTLIRMLTTLLRPTSGKAFVSGCDVSEEPAEANTMMRMIISVLMVISSLSIVEHLCHYPYLI